ncbi:cell division protein FtsX [Nannocystaceae bacterium ST9]
MIASSGAEDLVLWSDDDEADPAAQTLVELHDDDVLFDFEDDDEDESCESLEIEMHDIAQAATQPAGELAQLWIDDDEAGESLGQREIDLASELALEPEFEPTPSRRDPIRAPLWGAMNTMVYALGRGLRGMAQSPLVQLLAIGTMAVCMLLLATTLLLFQNARAIAASWGIDVPVTVYMQHGIDPVEVEALRSKLEALPEVELATRVTPEQALARLDEGVGDRTELLAGIDAGALPDSIELQLVSGVEPGFADALASRVQAMAGVDEVAALGPWVQQAEATLDTFVWLALGVAALVSLACLAIVWSTIRLGVFARRAELDILRLVGGTTRFVRAPFVVEGVLQGVLGTALALAGLWLVFDLIRPFVEQGMALVFAAGSIRFFQPLELGLAIAFGGVLGLLGSRAAVAGHAEA